MATRTMIGRYVRTPAVTRITMIRHGETLMNAAGTHIGGVSAHVPLSPRGVQQSKDAGHRLRNQGAVFAAAYVSTTLRTDQTFVYMNVRTATVIRTADAMEQSQGDWEGTPVTVYQRPDVAAAFAADNWGQQPGDAIKGESKRETAMRMLHLVECIRNQHGASEILIVTHGNAIRYMLAEMFDRPRHTAYRHNRIRNASATVIQCAIDGAWALEAESGVVVTKRDAQNQ